MGYIPLPLPILLFSTFLHFKSSPLPALTFHDTVGFETMKMKSQENYAEERSSQQQDGLLYTHITLTMNRNRCVRRATGGFVRELVYSLAIAKLGVCCFPFHTGY